MAWTLSECVSYDTREKASKTMQKREEKGGAREG